MRINYLVQLKEGDKMIAFADSVDSSQNLATYFKDKHGKKLFSINIYKSAISAHYAAADINEDLKKQERLFDLTFKNN